MGKWTRRAVLATGGLLGGGLVLGVGGLLAAPNRLGVRRENEALPQLTTWFKIAPDNSVIVVVPHCDMGQGVHTALAMMLAEELDTDWSLVRVEEAPAEPVYANGYLVPVFVPQLANPPQLFARGLDYASFKLSQSMGLQVTGGSSSVRGTGQFGMRVAGAAARAMLLQAAANAWQVDVRECTAKLSRVVHEASGRSATFGELAAAAAKLTPPDRPPLKPRSEYGIVGRPVPRFDIPAKVNGGAKYAIDVSLPGMLYATIAAAPVFGSKLESVDEQAAGSLPGVRRIVRLDNAVAVVADSYWRALKALRALQVEYTQDAAAAVHSAAIFERISAKLEGEKGKAIDSAGNAPRMLARAERVIEAEYRVPFVAHATMEPMCATAKVEGESCEVWTGVQDPLAARKVAAAVLGIDPDDVVVHNHLLGGGFGRRLPGCHDFVEQAVRIAKEMSPVPVKLIWSREEDLRHDYYRPAVLARFRAALDERGAPIAWSSKFNGLFGQDRSAALCPYAIEHRDIRAYKDVHHVRVGAWRSVAHSEHGFFTESFIDELAHAANEDPLAFRLKLLKDPRHRRVLERVAEMAAWGTPLAEGFGRGVAVVESFGTVVAEVAEVSVRNRAIKVERVFAAVDCGEVVHPDTAAAQIEGGIVFGLSATLFDAITIRNGAVEQANFFDYRLPKLADTPRTVVEFLKSDAPMGGLGEPGVPPIAPAVANAVFAATGIRLRELPLRLPG
jgi:isoquinoline 1-oxidoreductase beta subunit